MKYATNYYIDQIDQIISHYQPEGIGIIDGKGFRLLCYYELFRITGRLSYKVDIDEAYGLLAKELQQLSGKANPQLSTGLAGVLWLFCELKEDGLAAGFADTYTSAINEELVNGAIGLMETGKPGYLDGTYGILYYLLLVEQTGLVKKQAGRIMEKIIAGYTKGDVYKTFCGNHKAVGYNYELNLGVFDGLCGNLLVLIKACRMGYNKEYVLLETILKDGVGFILHHKIDIDYEDESYSFFPPVVKRNSSFIETSNTLAWFCSDLNHVLLLYEMNLFTGDVHYRELADYIGLQTIARKEFEATQVDSSIIFNGCSGIALFYKKLSTYGNKEAYLGAFNYWMEKTIIYLDKEVTQTPAIAGERGILNGLAGVLLTILSDSHESQPKWTKLFFL
jgi:lantibiotic biosynthesis protein